MRISAGAPCSCGQSHQGGEGPQVCPRDSQRFSPSNFTPGRVSPELRLLLVKASVVGQIVYQVYTAVSPLSDLTYDNQSQEGQPQCLGPGKPQISVKHPVAAGGVTVLDQKRIA